MLNTIVRNVDLEMLNHAPIERCNGRIDRWHFFSASCPALILFSRNVIKSSDSLVIDAIKLKATHNASMKITTIPQFNNEAEIGKTPVNLIPTYKDVIIIPQTQLTTNAVTLAYAKFTLELSNWYPRYAIRYSCILFGCSFKCFNKTLTESGKLIPVNKSTRPLVPNVNVR